jgi:crotonobetainyl-CoA:carnitine CoA-transferase CaiB-like acyl-CoA transferase
VSEWTKNKTKTEIFEQGQERGLECAPVYTIPEVYDDPQLAHRGYWVDVEHPELERSFTYSGAPYLLSETPWSMRRRAPLIGEDNDSIYGDELGLDDDELANLTQKRII